MRRTFFHKILSPPNWKGLIGLLRFSRDPLVIAWRYYFKRGTYPFVIRLRTNIGPVELDLYHPEDLVTIHEVFFRQDYYVSEHLNVAVDCGANIGISSSYFLSRNTAAKVIAYEPVPVNISRAKKNLAQFGDRVELCEFAMGTDNRTVRFGVEITGRYGGIDVPYLNEWIEVPCRCADEELQTVVKRYARIDVLKIDVEGMELPIIKSLSKPLLSATACILAECDGRDIDLSGFTYQQYLSIARFTSAS